MKHNSYRPQTFTTRKFYATCIGSIFDLHLWRRNFVLTTNVDHQFQIAGFDKRRLFYTQGDYGLWQCSKPCRQKTYDNEEFVREMIAQQKDMKIPTELIPRCPVCGAPMTMNLRVDILLRRMRAGMRPQSAMRISFFSMRELAFCFWNWE